MRLLTSVVGWKRVLVLLPVLALIAATVYLLAWRDDTSETPRAMLLETAALGDSRVGTSTGDVARDFLGYSPAGEGIRLTDTRGTPTVINFWASWCGSCIAELPDLRDLQAQYSKDRLRVLAVNVGESLDRSREFIERVEAESLTAVLDPTLVVADAYRVRGMPQSVFVDSDGIIRGVYVGQLTEDALREYTEAALTATDAESGEGPLRLVTTVARDRVLDVRQVSEAQAEFRSKSLRCDDAYCAAPVVDAVEELAGVESLEYSGAEDPPRLVLTYDSSVTDSRALADALADALSNFEDPLYTRPLEVRFN